MGREEPLQHGSHLALQHIHAYRGEQHTAEEQEQMVGGDTKRTRSQRDDGEPVYPDQGIEKADKEASEIHRIPFGNIFFTSLAIKSILCSL